MIKTIEIAPYIYAGELSRFLAQKMSWYPEEDEVRALILEFFLKDSVDDSLD